MTDNKEQLENELPPPKRQVARSNHAGSTTFPPPGMVGAFRKDLKTRGFDPAMVDAADMALDQAWAWHFANDPPPAEQATNSAHVLPTDAGLKKALEHVDWGQVAHNGGPPCFCVLDGCFCLRAERWEGHGVDHPYISLRDLLAALTLPGADSQPPTDARDKPAHQLPTGMTAARLAEIKARAEAATPGPWIAKEQCDGAYVHICGSGGVSIALKSALTHPRLTSDQRLENRHRKDTADFIAHARQDIPELIAEVERLRAALADRTKETA